MAKHRTAKTQRTKVARQPNSGGRPTQYSPKFCQIAASACARGATIAEIADLLGVTDRTIYRWKAQHDAFCQAIRAGASIANERVAFALYERAVGYTHDAVKVMQYEGQPVIVPYKEHVPPDVGAIKMWLTNRDRQNWSDTSRHEVTGHNQGPIEIKREVSDLDAARRVAFALGRALERAKAGTEN